MKSKPSTRKIAKAKEPKGFDQVYPNAAGIDIGANEHYVAVPTGRNAETVRCFSSVTCELHKLADWLKKCGIETIAMESTGMYWIPTFEILEKRGFDVILVHAEHVKKVPGRKTDVTDAQWIQQLHSYGLLNGCFRPSQEICPLRVYMRQRQSNIQQASTYVLHMQKALDQMNVQVHRAVSDITGKTGMKIIKAILAGEKDPYRLAGFRDRRCKKSVEEIAGHLEGNFQNHHMFCLRQALQMYEMCRTLIVDCETSMEQALLKLDPNFAAGGKKRPPIKRKASEGNAPYFDVEGYLVGITGVDLTAIEGISSVTALTIISEIGTDMTKWPSVQHFTSWLGLCPGNRITGGRIKSGKTRKVTNRTAIALRGSANSLWRSKGPPTYPGWVALPIG